MKTFLYFLSVLILGLLFSCKQAEVAETDFSFSEQQPVNDSKINHFPRNFIGNYIDTDSIYLILNDKNLIYRRIVKSNVSFEEFEKIKDSSRIDGNKIYYLNEKVCEFRKLKDSIEIAFADYDTLFSLSENQTAKRIKNAIILNTKDSIFWKINMVSLDKNKLTIKTLASFDDLRRIDSLSSTKVQKIDSTRNLVKLSRKEFKNMLKLKGFGYDHNFKKID